MSTKKPKQSTQQAQRLKYEQLLRKQKTIAQQYKNKLRPMVTFLRKHNLKFSSGSIGQTQVQYFRVDQFQKLLAQHYHQLIQNEQLFKIYSNIKSQLIYYKRPNHIKVKYPNKLQPVDVSNIDKKYASFRFNTTESKKWLISVLIGVAFILVLLPVWPYQLKYALWLVSFVLLVFLVSLILVRLVIYLFCSIFGYHVWILPNLLGDYGIWGSITPFLYYQKWPINLFNVLIRVFLLSSLIAAENVEMTKQVVNEIHDWGVMKIKNQKNFSQRAITNLDVILNQTKNVDEVDYQYVNLQEKDNKDSNKNEQIQLNLTQNDNIQETNNKKEETL